MQLRFASLYFGFVMLAMVGFFLLFPQLKPDWIKIHVGKGRSPARSGSFYSRQTSWSAPSSRAPTRAEASFDRGTLHLERREWDQAIEAFSEVLRREPKNGHAFYHRGLAHYGRQQLDAAAADFDAALRIKPKDAGALVARATIRNDQGQRELALADLDSAIRAEPDYAESYSVRGKVREEAGEYRQALADYEQASRLAPDDPLTLNDVAWLLATAPEPALRNGPRAVKAALRAVEIEEAKEWDTIDTLGAAFAEVGKFSDAVRCQHEALRLAPPEEHSNLKARLELYQAKQPYRLSADK